MPLGLNSQSTRLSDRWYRRCQICFGHASSVALLEDPIRRRAFPPACSPAVRRRVIVRTSSHRRTDVLLNRWLNRTMTEGMSAFCELLHTAGKSLEELLSPIQRLARVASEVTSACPSGRVPPSAAPAGRRPAPPPPPSPPAWAVAIR